MACKIKYNIEYNRNRYSQLFSPNQSIFVDFIDFITRRKTFNFGINTAFYPWYHVSYEITSEREQGNKNGKSSTKTHGEQVECSENKQSPVSQ